MKNVLNILALASSAAALAVPEKRADAAFESKFDDLATTIVVPQLFPVGEYNGLSWGALVVLRPIDGLASVVPHSGKQHAGAAGPLDLLYLGQLTLNTFATITPGNNVKTFDLSSFWWGFGTDTGTTFGLAQPGTLYVVAYDANDKQLEPLKLEFKPEVPFNAPLVYAQLPETFKGLKNVTLAVEKAFPITERTYIALDNVKHVNHF